MEKLQLLFRQHVGREAESCQQLTADGSPRRYYRLGAEGGTMIGAVGTSAEENRAFVAIARQMCRQGLPAPEIYAVAEDGMRYLQEDLGDASLFGVIGEAQRRGGYDETDMELLRSTVRLLPDVQWKTAEGFDFAQCHPSPELDRRGIQWDLHYFKYCFLKATRMEFDEERLEDDFDHLATVLLEGSDGVFMYRDFQSRNVMIRDGQPWLIDFQGGRRGPA